MRYPALLSLLLCFCLASSIAQTSKLPFEVVKGPLVEEKKLFANDYIGYNGGHYIMEGAGGSFYSSSNLLSFTKDLKFDKEQKIEIKVDKKFGKLDNYYSLGNKLYVFFHYRDKKEDKTNFYCQQIDSVTLLPIGEQKLLLSTTDDLDDFSIIQSHDKSKFAVFTKPDVKKDESVYLESVVYDNEFKKLWYKKITLKYTEKLFNLEQYRLSNDGNVYLLGILYDGKEVKKVKGEPNYSYKVFTYNADENDKQEYTASLSDQFITDLGIDVSDNGQLMCAGFYSEKGLFSIKGCFYMSVDPTTNEVITQEKKEFDAKTLAAVLSTKKIEKGAELASFDLDHIIARKDGSTIILGEQFYITTSTYTTTSNGVTTTHTITTYHYNHILAAMVDPDGHIKWATIVPKYSTDETYSYAIDANGVYIFYNETKENIAAKSIDDFKGGCINCTRYPMVAYLDNDGVLKKYALLNNLAEKDVLTLNVSASKQATDDSFFFYTSDKKHYQAGYIKLQP